jgi:hypothetical protein
VKHKCRYEEYNDNGGCDKTRHGDLRNGGGGIKFYYNYHLEYKTNKRLPKQFFFCIYGLVRSTNATDVAHIF